MQKGETMKYEITEEAEKALEYCKKCERENTCFTEGAVIRTLTGKYIDVANPHPDMICIQDIAEGLAYNYRFGGLFKNKVTIAEHSIDVYIYTMGLLESLKLDQSITELVSSLMHDASEAYIRDIPSPIKRFLTDYVALEDKLMSCIAYKYGFDWPVSAVVKKADGICLKMEWLNNLSQKPTLVYKSSAAKRSWLDMLERYININN